MNLLISIRILGKNFKMYANRLEKLGIYTIKDLLFHIPSRYENYAIISQISLTQQGEIVTIQGKVTKKENIWTRSRKKIQKIVVTDNTGDIECIWFNQPFVLKNIQEEDIISIAGRIEHSSKKKSILVNEYEILKDGNLTTYHTGRLVPIYPETRGVSSKWIRNRVKELLNEIDENFNEYLPEDILKSQNLLDYRTAIKQIHFPDNLEIAVKAKQRLAFDELLLTQLKAMHRKSQWDVLKVSYPFKIFKDKLKGFINSLPFELTNAQKKAINEILLDLASDRPMNRLLEGDVGSGKTVIAAIAMYLAYLNGFQSALMAPTEILANQHYDTISKLLSPLGVKIELITSNCKYKVSSIKYQGKKKSKKILDTKYLIPDTNILIGTHALLNKDIKFNKLGLVIIDEQQRFGVEQRSILRKKGINPHFLTMTATPIPRTIFLTLYGDLDLSYLDEMPKGRKEVKTWLVPNFKREASYEWIKKKIRETDVNGNKNQVFLVCPFIEESESMKTVKAAIKEYEKLKDDVFNEFNIGLLHGKMKAKEKDKILDDFKDGKIDILVATPVVEVGIDIKNATIMIIEEAQRFGLAQLHQLRGRVGRSSKESFCLLFSGSASRKSIDRLKHLESNHLGAKLAEYDLRLRGPGEIYGTIQHGVVTLKIASFSDFELIEKTKIEAEKIFHKLSLYPLLDSKLKEMSFENVAPD